MMTELLLLIMIIVVMLTLYFFFSFGALISKLAHLDAIFFFQLGVDLVSTFLNVHFVCGLRQTAAISAAAD